MRVTLAFMPLLLACQHASDHYISGLADGTNGGARVQRQYATGYGDVTQHNEEIDIDNTGRIISTMSDVVPFNGGSSNDLMLLANRGITIASGSCHDPVTITSAGSWSLVPPDFHSCSSGLTVDALSDSMLLAGNNGDYYEVIIRLGFDGLVRWRTTLP
jgi:hypothetical protein